MGEKPLWDWDGPYGGLPPYDRATPAALARDLDLALTAWRAAIQRIAEDPRPANFSNTIEALESAYAPLNLVLGLFTVVSTTSTSAEIREVEGRLSATIGTLDDQLADAENLFSRIETVHASAREAKLAPDQVRVIENYRGRLIRHGARLGAADRGVLAGLNARLAAASSEFVRNFTADDAERYTLFRDERDLDGMDEAFRNSAAKLAETRGHAGAWAVGNVRQVALNFLANARDRSARERVWREWTARGEHPGPRDNRPLMAEILRLRGRKARLLGYPNYAAMQLEDRMAGTPEKALDMLFRTWEQVRITTARQFEAMASIAAAEGMNNAIAPWDSYYFAEKDRGARFGLDAEEVRQYLTVDGVIDAVLDASSRLHGLDFSPLPEAPLLAPTIRPYLVSRRTEPVGIVYIDIVARDEKRRGSWQSQVRPASSFDGRVLPVATVVTSVEPGALDEPIPMSWESANVTFHEFGHGLHMLLCEARYPTIGSLSVAWDIVELPALINEQWLLDRALLQKHMRHARTGEPIPLALIDKIEAGLRYDRVFSTRASYLLGAIADLRLHMAADGRELDAIAVENETRRDLGVPDGVDAILRMPHFFHIFGTDQYSAGLYVYLWGDVLAADVAERFKQSEGGLYDAEMAERWRSTILSVGSAVAADHAFKALMGREPDPGALMRRFEVPAQDALAT